MKTSEASTRAVVTAGERATLPEVAKLMRDNHVGCVVVVDSAGSLRPVGIVTDRDIVVEAVAASLDVRTLTAGNVMTRELVTACGDDDVGWALKIMRERGFRRLPIVDADGRLSGLLSLDDLLGTASTAISDVVQAIGMGRVVESFRRTPRR